MRASSSTSFSRCALLYLSKAVLPAVTIVATYATRHHVLRWRHSSTILTQRVLFTAPRAVRASRDELTRRWQLWLSPSSRKYDIGSIFFFLSGNISRDLFMISRHANLFGSLVLFGCPRYVHDSERFERKRKAGPFFRHTGKCKNVDANRLRFTVACFTRFTSFARCPLECSDVTEVCRVSLVCLFLFC